MDAKNNINRRKTKKGVNINEKHTLINVETDAILTL